METRCLVACLVLAGSIACGKPPEQPAADSGGEDQEGRANRGGPAETLLGPSGAATAPGKGSPASTDLPSSAALDGALDADSASCLKHMRRLATGLLWLTQDSGGVFKITPANWRAQLGRYLNTSGLFHCPGDKGEGPSYSLNPRISGIRTSTLREPYRVVLLYEGKNGKLDFRHGGMAAVAFADAHCDLLTPAGAEQVVWKPAGGDAPTTRTWGKG